MQTIRDRWKKLRTRFAEITTLRRVEILPVERLIDDSFWNGLKTAAVPAAYVALKTDVEEGKNARNDCTWGVVIVAHSLPHNQLEDVSALLEAARGKLDYAWTGTKFYLQPGSRATYLQVLPQMAVVELEIYTSDFD
jgi:hypothetical protein